MSWKAWALDAWTWAFIIGWLWFIAWETAALVSDSFYGTWTAHLQPLFNEALITWVLGQAFLGWLWIHIFYPPVERAIIDFVGRL